MRPMATAADRALDAAEAAERAVRDGKPNLGRVIARLALSDLADAWATATRRAPTNGVAALLGVKARLCAVAGPSSRTSHAAPAALGRPDTDAGGGALHSDD